MPKSPRPGRKSRGNDAAGGAPKKRWSAEQRAATGRKPRRGGSDDRFSGARGANRDDRAPRGDGYRDSRWRPDSETGQRFERDDRQPSRSTDRFSNDRYGNDRYGQDRYSQDRFGADRRDSRGSRDRLGSNDAGGRRGYGARRDDRASQFEDSGRPARDWAPRRGEDSRGGSGRDSDRRDFRSERGDRRGGWQGRDERSYGSDRRFGDDRPARGDRADRPRREAPWTRDDRPARADRFDADQANDRNRSYERPSYARGERPAASRPVNDHHPKRDDWRRPASAHGGDRRRDGGNRDRREQAHEFEHSELAADTMDWQAPELGELDPSSVSDQAPFAQLGVPQVLVAALDKKGISEPFPIQRATIPDAISGRDVLGRGQTGSGKTLGFGLPLLTRLSQADPTGGAPRAVVLVPTRELALQVADVLSPLARSLDLDLILVAGGMSYGPQLRAFERGVDIVVATPGRLIDLMDQGAADLSQVLVTVLDEADHMADLGFLPEVRQILDAVPAQGQRLLFSATLDHAVDRVVREYLHNPTTHEVDENKATITTMEHLMLLVQPSDKDGVTATVANREGRTVIFVRTQLGANRVAEQLRRAGVMAGALHGGLTQGARSRILQAFRDGTVPVLVATDVAARGIHVDDVSLVLQVDPPMNAKDYLHRAGRTARAGDKGVVVTLSLPHQRRSVSRLLGSAGAKHQPIMVKPDDEQLAELTGAKSLTGDSISDADYEALIAPKQPVRSARPGRRPAGRREGGRREGGRAGGFGGRGQGGGFRRGNGR